MADTVTSTKLNDGDRNVAYHFTNESDGTGEAAVTKVDVSALTPAPAEVSIMKIIYSTRGMGVNILFGADTDVLAVALPPDRSGCIDYTKIGGLKNVAGDGKTGDIKFTTVGHDLGDGYAITMVMKKQ